MNDRRIKNRTKGFEKALKLALFTSWKRHRNAFSHPGPWEQNPDPLSVTADPPREGPTQGTGKPSQHAAVMLMVLPSSEASGLNGIKSPLPSTKAT
jgi:hypothetical protein